MQRLFALAIPSIVCAAVQASDFRFCEMEGAVESVSANNDSRPRMFDLVVRVASSRKEKGERGELGYTDCSEYIGERVDVLVEIPRRHGEPVSGDRIIFNYSSVDGFDANGKFAGTSIDASLLDYRNQKQ